MCVCMCVCFCVFECVYVCVLPSFSLTYMCLRLTPYNWINFQGSHPFIPREVMSSPS